ncbi:MAG: phytanoyl-CoA dioxygenase family protein [Candidatus Hydrogenedentes bacterium]|nr:phytanoyl-CoA dioxygenase family protein [Candidatus Hydrogenedentota bacterium]
MATEAVSYRVIHTMAGTLFASLADAGGASRFRLTDAQVAEYRERGFVKGPRVLDPRQIEVLRAGLERIRTGENERLPELYEIDDAWKKAPEKSVFHFLGAWRIDEAFHDILFHPAITVPVSQLLDSPRVRFWHDQVFYKPPRHPGVVAWHQDYSYWTRSVPARHLTVWIGLDDSTLANGCIHFVPGSHRWPLLPKLQLLENMDGIKDILTPEQLAEFKPEPLELKAGECSIHHCMTLHGSYGNQSDIPRRGVVLNYMHPETRSADGKHPLLLHTPPIPEGEIIEGDDFPIVYEE